MRLKKEIQALTREVEQLHPLLHRLFSAMPNVKRVHYTQGSSEMGADFVLERDDSDLEECEFIGVVVKIGKISQSHSEVDRQIEECQVRRLLNGSEIYINAVWVVSNGSISRNAQEKIREKHKATNVRFIAIDSLCGLIERHLDGSIEETPIILQDYARKLRADIELAERSGELVPGLSDVFVEPEIHQIAEDSAGFLRKEKQIGSIEGLKKFIAKNRLCLFEARMGGGKSKAIRKLAISLIDDEKYSLGKVLPVLISAQRFFELISGDSDLHTCLLPENFDAQASAIFMLVDGFDEVEMEEAELAENLDKVFDILKEQPNIHLLLSSRPVDRYTGPLHARFDKFERLEIEPLRGKKAIAFLSKVADATTISERVIKDLQSNNLVKAFDSTPIAYILLGSLLKQHSKELPATIPDLFERYFSLVLERWEIEKGLLGQKESQVMLQGLEQVAARMFESGSFQLAESEVLDIFRDYISERDIAGVHADVVTDKLCTRCMVLYKSGSNKTIAFRHRTFSEYFFARHWLRVGERNLDYSAFTYSRVTSAYFFVGALKDCPEVISQLSEMNLPEGVLRFSRMIHFGNMLQAAYTTPSKIRREALKRVICDAASLYFEIADGGVDTPLAKLSRVHLLGFFRNVIVDCYSYNDFARHAESVVGELMDGNKSRECALAVFFCVLIKAEYEKSLDFADFIDEYGNDLPIEIKLGITHEERLRFSALTKATKKMAKNLKASLKNNPGARKFIDDLYNIPIDAGLKQTR